LDLDFVRSQFPAFSEPSLEGWGFFENAGGSYACGQVIERLQRYYRANKVQPYYPFPASTEAGRLMDGARQRMAACLNVATEEVHFGPSTSQNTYVLAQALRQHLQPGDEIVVTNLEHEANVGALRRLEADGIVVREWRMDPESAELDPGALDAWLTAKTRAVAFTHCSNIVGSINPVREIVDRVHAAGAIAIVDGVSYCPHGLPDIAALGADVYLFSLYKVYGPHLGVMHLRDELNRRLPNQGHFFNENIATARFTPAGPDHAQIASVNGVIDYLEAIHSHHFETAADAARQARAVRELFQQHERSLLPPLLEFLSAHPKVRLIGKERPEGRAPTVSFTVEGQRPEDLAARLAEYKLGVGAGHFYAYRLIEVLGIDTDEGVLRTSFVHYTSAEEVNRLIEALDRLI
jgi:cysteine desulfurase family protein (TIGR01976 family)